MKDFGFALNNSNFSDRVLQIEIVSDVSDSKPMSAGSALHSHDSESELFGAKVTTLHISSLLLAQQSPFFYKLFENGMKESQQRHLTLTMNTSEEAGLKDVLNFIYKNTLNANTVPDLLNVLMVADKYEVVSCMEYCCELLQNVPMSLENALLYIGLPSSVLMGEQVEHLLDVTKEFLVKRYKYLSKSKEEAMTLPLPAIEVVLSSKGLQVNTEDAVFKFILEWVRAHYPEIEERKEIVAKHLVKLICFPSMTSTKLKEVVDCPEFDNEQVLKLVLKALLIKVEVPYGQPNCCTCTCLGRIYEYRPIKMEQFEVPQSRCTIYFNLKKEECEKLFTTKYLVCQPFVYQGRRFFLKAQFSHEVATSSHHFGLFVHMTPESQLCSFDLEIAVVKKPYKEFQVLLETHVDLSKAYLTKKGGCGDRDLFTTPWANFVRNDSDYFSNDTLRLRVELSAINDD